MVLNNSAWMRCFALFGCIIVADMPVAMATDRYSVDDLLAMSVEELVNVKVTTLSKHEEKYMSTAGAVFIISQDDIRRSGARSIPEALRLAPGLQVSQTNMNQYQIGIRGQTDFFTDLLLVMVDNRPIYTTTFSGVWWVAQNYPLEDIERIEVVRGSGGAIWGSNAVNGVVNIITKHADTQQGLRISGGAGTEDKGFGNISYSSKLKGVNYRLYGMNELRDGGLGTGNQTILPKDKASPDFRRMNQQGFRLDWNTNDATQMSLHGDVYRVTTGVAGFWMPIVTTPAQPGEHYKGLNKFTGRNLVFRMEKELTTDIKLIGQLLYDQSTIDTKVIHEKKETFDGDFQLDVADVLSQNISVGMDLRRLRSRYDNTPQFQMPSRMTGLASFFINDELSLLDGHLRIIGGVKLERNSYTKWINQPSVRAVASNDNWALWVAASRAARTPNDMENGLRWNLRRTAGKVLRQVGDGRAKEEKVTSYEVGARLRPNKDSLIEVTGFKILYKGVLDTWQNRSATNPFIINGIVPEYLTNVLNGKGDGFEANFRYQPAEWIALKGSYTYLHQNYIDYPIQDSETIWTVKSNKGQDPKSRFHIGASLNPFENIEFDTNFYFTGPFREGDVNGYHKFDMRVAWKPIKELEISLVGQDILKASYKSNIDSIMGYESKIQQRYYMQAVYNFN